MWNLSSCWPESPRDTFLKQYRLLSLSFVPTRSLQLLTDTDLSPLDLTWKPPHRGPALIVLEGVTIKKKPRKVVDTWIKHLWFILRTWVRFPAPVWWFPTHNSSSRDTHWLFLRWGYDLGGIMRGSGVNIIKISCMAFSELIKILV